MKNINQVKLSLLCNKHKVKELYLFSSVLTNKFSNSNDIDFLAQFHTMDLNIYFDNYMDFKDELENLFNRKVDLVENQAIKNPVFRKIIDKDKQLIYGQSMAS